MMFSSIKRTLKKKGRGTAEFSRASQLQKEKAEEATTEAICPHCNTTLEEMPAQKTTCPSCNEAIYVKARPADNVVVLLKNEELPGLE